MDEKSAELERVRERQKRKENVKLVTFAKVLLNLVNAPMECIVPEEK